MRLLLAVLSLLVALAVVTMLVRTQSGAAASAAIAVAASGPASDAPASLRQVPRQVADDIAKALEQGAQRRADDADR